MKYKLLALDIDSTFVPDGVNIPSEKVAEAIRNAAKKIRISLITARSGVGADRIIKHLNLEHSYHAIENGAKILNSKGEIEYDLHIPHTEVQQILNASKDFFDEVGFCTDSHWNNDLENPVNQIVNGLSFSCINPQNAFKIAQAIEKLSVKYAVYPGRHWSVMDWGCVLVFHKDATKGKGLSYIQRKLKIKPDETIAVGDAVTDLPMFQYAGLKVAMGNAEDALKEKADVIAPSVSEDGIVEIIQKYILGL